MDKEKRLPLLLPLRDFEQKMESFIVNGLNQMGIEDINYTAFLKRLGDGELVLMLDGFDEMTQHIEADKKKSNFAKIRRLMDNRPGCKLILTVRQEYFRSLSDLEDVVKYPGKGEDETVYLLPFDDGQIKRFLRSRIANPDFYWEHIVDTFELKDLAKRPVLLQLIVDHLPGLIKEKGEGKPVNASDLYRRCIADELARKAEHLDLYIRSNQRLALLERLAVWMFINDTLSIDIGDLEEELDLAQYLCITSHWETEKYLNEFLTFSFLIREGTNRFRMSHKSFRDYLTATAFVKEIDSGKTVHFGKNKTTDEINRFILEQNPDKTKLLHLVETARYLDETNRFQGGNGCRLLLKMDESALKGRDLTGCHLPGVDFGWCDLTDTIFNNAELINCSLNESIFSAKYRNINVENSFLFLDGQELEDVEFITAFKNPSMLNLGSNKLTEVRPLAELKELKVLWLNNNQLTDVTPLTESKELKGLWLNNNQLTDVTPLAELEGLTHLGLEYNQLTDVTPLAELNGLTTLYLHDNQLTDVTPLAKLKQLKDLYIDKNQETTLATQLSMLEKEIPGLEIKVWG